MHNIHKATILSSFTLDDLTMVPKANTKFGISSSSFSFLLCSCRRIPTIQFRQESKTVIVITLIALLVLQSPAAFLFFSSYGQNDFLAFASSSVSQSDTATRTTTTPSSSFSSLSRPLAPEQPSQFQSLEQSSAPSIENFSLPDGYIIEPFIWNLSLPTSIAVDSTKGAIYVAESNTNESDTLDGTNSNNTTSNNYSNSNNSTTSPSSPIASSVSFSQHKPPEVKILKADLGNRDNNSLDFNQSNSIFGGALNIENTTIFNNTLQWPVIDMETDPEDDFLYAFHDHTAVSRINTTSGGREDIIFSDANDETDDNNHKQIDPLALLVNSSSQIALGGMDRGNYSHSNIDDQSGSNHSGYLGSILYVPCINNQDGDGIHGKYCILGLPTDSSVDTASIDDVESLNNSSSFVLQNLMSRPVGMAMINSSFDTSDGSSSSSVSSPSLTEQGTTPFSLTRNQTSYSINDNNTEDNPAQLLIIASPEQINNNYSSSNQYSGNSHDNSKLTRIGYGTSNYSADALASQTIESIIYRANIFESVQSQKSNSNDIQDNIGSNSSSNYYYSTSNSFDDNSTINDNQLQASSPTIATLLNYSDGQLGKVVVIPVSSDTNTSSSSAPDNTTLPTSFGLNDTTAFVIDHGFANSSAQSDPTHLPKIMMLDVQTGNFVPFLTHMQPNSDFMPVDVAFDYIHNNLYVLSISNNREGDEGSNNIDDQLSSGTSNNDISGVIWKISYVGTEGEPIVNSSDSTFDNGTDNSIDDSNSDNETTDETSSELTESSSNDTGLNDSSTETDDTTSDSGILEEDTDDVDDDEFADSSSDDLSSSSSDSNSNSSDTSSEDTSGESDDDSSSSSTSDNTGDSSTDTSSDSSSSEDTTPSSSTDDDSSSPPSQPSTEPENEPPEAEEDSATTDQGTPVVIDVLANDSDTNNDDTITIDSVDERSIQGGNVEILSSGSNSGSAEDDTANNDMNNNNNNDVNNNNNNDNIESNTNAKIQYTPAEGFIGNDEFTYTIIDNAGASDTAKVTVRVGEVVIAPQPISYWLENEDGITESTLENAANENENNNDDWSFKLGNFEVPKDFDVSDSENDTKGVLEAGQGGSNVNTFDQLAAQLLASKLNIQNAASTCVSIENSIEDADASLRINQYDGPSSSENLTDDNGDSTQKLIESLDNYNNNNGCI